MYNEYERENKEYREELRRLEDEEFERNRREYFKRKRKENSGILRLEFEDMRWEKAWGLEEPYIQGYEEKERW